MFITNNHPSFHLWRKENLLNHEKVSKYYEDDCRTKEIPSGSTSNRKVSAMLLLRNILYTS